MSVWQWARHGVGPSVRHGVGPSVRHGVGPSVVAFQCTDYGSGPGMVWGPQ